MTTHSDFRVPPGAASGSRDADLFLPPSLLRMYRFMADLVFLALEGTDKQFAASVFHDDRDGDLRHFDVQALGGPLSGRGTAMDDVRRRLRAVGCTNVILCHEAWRSSGVPDAVMARLPSDMARWPEAVRRKHVKEAVIMMCECRGHATVVLDHQIERTDDGRRRVCREPTILPGTAQGRFVSLLSDGCERVVAP